MTCSLSILCLISLCFSCACHSPANHCGWVIFFLHLRAIINRIKKQRTRRTIGTPARWDWSEGNDTLAVDEQVQPVQHRRKKAICSRSALCNQRGGTSTLKCWFYLRSRFSWVERVQLLSWWKKLMENGEFLYILWISPLGQLVSKRYDN